jgi:hypothetical protein
MDTGINTPKFNISELVDDLRPVTPLGKTRGLIIPALLTAAFICVIIVAKGLRADLISGHPAEMFLIRAGILLLLGTASAHAVISMACPAVGKHSNGWQMALAGALLFPLSAMIVASSGDINPSISMMKFGLECMMMSAIGALAIAIPMVIWLRRGAPTSLNRAGWLTGLASGGLAAFAYNLHCPFSDLAYTGLWYSLSVGVCALAGRAIVPRLIRW